MNYKKYLRAYAYNLLGLELGTRLIEGLDYSGGIKTLFLAALALLLVNLVVKPLIKLLFLPINLLTLGMFSWVVNVLALYLVTVLVPELTVKGFLFSGYSYQGFTMPALNISPFWTTVLASFFISLFVSFFNWLRK